MSHKQSKSGIAVKSLKKVAKNGVKKTESALALIADRLHDGRRAVKHARATATKLSGRAQRLVKSHPVRVLLGAAAAGFILAKLKLFS